MTEQSVSNKFMLRAPGSSAGERSIICGPYRAPGFANFSMSDSSLARSYSPAVEGKLLPEAATENSRARACGRPPSSCIVRNPVGVAEQPLSEIFTSAVFGELSLTQVSA